VSRFLLVFFVPSCGYVFGWACRFWILIEEQQRFPEEIFTDLIRGYGIIVAMKAFDLPPLTIDN
jgi:hypothetical protein